MLRHKTEFNKTTSKCVNVLVIVMKDPQCAPIYEQNYCSQEAA